MENSAQLSAAHVDAYNAQLQSSALNATRLSASLPSDIPFYRSLGKEIAKDVDNCTDKALSVLNKLLGLAASGSESRSRKRARIESEEDVVDQFHGLVVDAMDYMLEQTDMRLDEFLGHSRAPAISVNPPSDRVPKERRPKAAPGRLDPVLQHASRLPKPQLNFKRKVDNSRSATWRSTLRHKYNAKVPLGYRLEDEDENDADGLISSHPYYYEIKNIQYPSRMFEHADPIPPKSFQDTPFTWVDTPTAFSDMLDSLRGSKEIAIDLEYHSYRTFSGFVCLMQISTRTGDWIVDTLALREELEELNEVFTDPNIVKVLHGAESDIVWLQQDFNLYIVNLFDTFHASKVLDFPRHGLATLLEMYCDFTPDKRYQLADWRIRPLPQEMLDYARSDTHYLLFIYDNLRNALLDRSQSRAQSRMHSPSAQGEDRNTLSEPPSPISHLREVLSRSEETALRVYESEVYDAEGGSGPGGWDTLAKKWNKSAMFSGDDGSVRMSIYKRVHEWRDRVAREEDESPRYVLSNHFLFVLAERPPRDMAGLLAMFPSVPPVLKRRAKELLDEIRDAIKSASEQPAANNDAIASQPAQAPAPTPSPKPEEVAAPSTFDQSKLFGTSAKAPAVSRSSLFGNSLPSQTPVDPYIKKISSLFAQTEAPRQHKRGRFDEVKTRIHKSLAITPSVPIPPTPSTSQNGSTPEVISTESVKAEDPGAAAEIPFVPSAHRQTESIRIDQDTIVAVGISRQRKRKRTTKSQRLVAEMATAETKSGSNSGEEDIQVATAAESNILDEGSDHEAEGGIGRKKKLKPPENFTGNFRAPPKAYSTLKSGNQSRTFR